MLIDSNIIIYAAQAEHGFLRRFIAENNPAVSAVSYVEVLGYHGLSPDDRKKFERFFASARVLALSSKVLEEAVRVRQLRKMKLGDALVAGTALAHRLTLVTRNAADFEWIPGAQVLNPFEEV